MKRPAIFLIVFVALVGFIWGSCTREQLNATCNTSNMSYSNNIVPILKNNCYTCHSKGNSVGSVGILLDSYDSVRHYVATNQLILDIEHEVGGVPMPYMKPKLDTCSINVIIAWRDQGYQP